MKCSLQIGLLERKKGLIRSKRWIYLPKGLLEFWGTLFLDNPSFGEHSRRSGRTGWVRFMFLPAPVV